MNSQLLSIVDDKIVIDKLRLTWLEGDINHIHNFNVQGSVSVRQSLSVRNNINVGGELVVDTIKVKNIIKEGESKTAQLDAFTYEADSTAGLDEKGLVWSEPNQVHMFVFRDEPRRIFSSENIDLHKNAKYQIGGVDVLEQNRLSASVTQSSLRTVGLLDNLKVRGDVEIGESFFFQSGMGRLGLNTDQPNGALSVVDGLTEVIISSSDQGHGVIGTWTNQPLDIVTDNVRRITVNGNTVEFGTSGNKNAIVKIHGTLEVDSIVNDIRVERTSPIEFVESDVGGLYNKGLSWIGTGTTKRFHLFSGPDRFFSSEDIDLNKNRAYRISNKVVITETGLGEGIKESHLTKLGILENLSVSGNINLKDLLVIDETVTVKSNVSVGTADGVTTVKGNGIESSGPVFSLEINGTKELGVNTRGNIVIGNVDNQNRVVNLHGRLAVNVNNPDPEAAFSVNGMMMMNNRRFTEGMAAPQAGQWSKGDIVWNSDPKETNYIGWVCITSGTPGAWKPFGYIGTR
jgi:hypothetical protein